MEMVDGLASVGASVDDDTIAMGQAFFASNLRCCRQQSAEESRMVVVGESKRRDVFAGNYEKVRWRLWVDVKERNAMFILENEFRGYRSVHDLAEEAVHIGTVYSVGW